MRSRRDFLRNSMMAIAVSLLPKPLHPQEGFEVGKLKTVDLKTKRFDRNISAAYFLTTTEMLNDKQYIKQVLEKRFSHWEKVGNGELFGPKNIVSLKVIGHEQ